MMETRPAVRTTEFWLTIAGNVAAIVTMVAGVLPPEYGVPAQMGANALYAIGRGVAKMGVKPE
jgi:hypothetical protein